MGVGQASAIADLLSRMHGAGRWWLEGLEA
jgi:hypothetical protein